MADHRFPQAVSDYKVDVACGRVVGARQLVRYGRRTALAAAAVADLWPASTAVQVRLTSAERMSVVSSSANDTSAGTGARTVTIQGLNSAWVEVTETVTLSGTTPVLTVGTFLRVNGMFVATAGSGGVNAGAITATSEITTRIQSAIEAGNNKSSCSHYTIPLGYKGIIQGIGVSALRNEDVLYTLSISHPTETGDLYTAVVTASAGLNVTDVNFGLSEKTDIRLQVTGVTNNTNPMGHYSLMLIPN